MIDKLQNMYSISKISAFLPDMQGQQPSKTSRGVTTDNKLQTTDSKARNSELREVAKEMEAVFSYQLIKEMRKMSESMSDKNDLGSDTYMSLFDMEISKLFADSGMGLQDAIMRWLERAPNTADVNDSDGAADIPESEAPEKAEDAPANMNPV